MFRSILAVVVAVITWFLVATILNLVLRALLPGYSAAEVTFAFTLPMMLCRLGLGLVASLCAGLVGASIADRNTAAKITAGMLVALFIPVHYMLWDKFPIWYHLFFLVTLAPTVLLGAALVRRPLAARISAQA
jgi:hypothetical protein